jgi:hypothetical protein
MTYSGMLPMEITSPVLVAEDTIYSVERKDHNLRLLMNQRPAVTAPSQPLFRLTVPPPSPTFFADTFVSVVPVLEAFNQTGPPKPIQQFFAYFPPPSSRLADPDPEDSTRRIDLGMLHAFRWRQASGVMPWFQEIPDLCDSPWLEWVRPPPSPDLALFAIRRPTPPAPKYQFSVLSYRATNPAIEAEADTPRVRNHALDFYPFRQNIAPLPPLAGPWVQAVAEGYYQGVLRLPGDVFKLANVLDLADASVTYPGGIQGWMAVLPGTPPPLQQVQSLVVQGQTSPPRTVY